ncbi:hypothetical protein [Burkholderia multivorans]|uniref:hypothetical protein n=1 Tax=Burkholderia multivorans TaxID=87883 RepID=UPI0020B41E0C|nr:hypothetical protein [Burkholderia multivorans]
MKDYEYVIFGGNDPEMRIGGALRRMLPIDVQVALRDAEKDLASWRNSPLRPLIEDLAASLDDDAREEIQNQVDQAQRELAGHEEVVATAERISERLIAIAGGQHGTCQEFRVLRSVKRSQLMAAVNRSPNRMAN